MMTVYSIYTGAPLEVDGPDVPPGYTDVPAPAIGLMFLDGQWTDGQPRPLPPAPAAAPAPKVSPVEFKLLFTAPERVAIKTARSSDPVLDDFFDIIEDPRLQVVDLGLQSVRDGVQYLADQSLIAADRAPEILAGVFQ